MTKYFLSPILKVSASWNYVLAKYFWGKFGQMCFGQISYFITPVWLTSSIMWFYFTAYFVICWFWRFMKLKCIYITNKLYSYKKSAKFLSVSIALVSWVYLSETIIGPGFCCWTFLEITQLWLWPCLFSSKNFGSFNTELVFYLNNKILWRPVFTHTLHCVHPNYENLAIIQHL